MADRILQPNITVPLIPATPVAEVAPKVTTFIASMLTGTATAGEVQTDIDVNTEDALFGANSDIATAIREFRKTNKVSRIDAIGVDASAATAAEGAFIFAGVATTSGELIAYIGNEDRSYKIPIAVGDAATDIGDFLTPLINADIKSLVSADNAAMNHQVDLTALNKGAVGNGIGIKLDGSVAGITFTFTAMASGASDPSIDSLVSLLEDRTDLIIPNEYGIEAFKDELDTRFNSSNIALDGRLITSVTDTKDNLVTLGNTQNSQSLIYIGDKPVSTAIKEGSAIFAMPYEKAASFQAIRTLRLEDGQSVAGLVTTTASNDNIGGAHMNSLPLFNTKTTMPVIPRSEGFTELEVEDLTTAGVSVLGNNRARNTVITGEIVTTYKTNVQGLPDTTFKFLNYVDTSTAAREFILNSLAADYGQARLTLGSSVAGHDIATIGGVRVDMISYMDILSGEGFVLLQGGTTEGGQSIASIIDANLRVSFDVQAGDINISSILPIITQTRNIIAPLSITFNVNSVA